jgi:hypothetical protein
MFAVSGRVMFERFKNLFNNSNRLSNDKENTEITSFHNRYDWQTLEMKYYEDLSFINYFEKPEKIRSKKQILQSEVAKRKFYSICYFDAGGYPIRIDNLGGYMPTETHLVWENKNLIEVCEFALGYKGVTKVKPKPHPIHYWSYIYDEQERTSRIFMICFEDHIYYAHDKDELRIRYEYDQKGLAKSYKQLFNFPPPTHQAKPIYDERLVYDREYQEALANCTVSKIAYLSTHRKPKEVALFKRQIDAIELTEIPLCTKCNQLMDFVGYVDLRDSRIQKKSSLEIVPIFFCFDCLQWEIITFDFANKSNFREVHENEMRVFPEAEIDFIKATGKEEEEQKKALVKIGGMPNWIQDEEWPVCPNCKNKMLFVCQVNTDESISNGKFSQAFGDSGTLYVFNCCKYVSTVMQCY